MQEQLLKTFKEFCNACARAPGNPYLSLLCLVCTSEDLGQASYKLIVGSADGCFFAC